MPLDGMIIAVMATCGSYPLSVEYIRITQIRIMFSTIPTMTRILSATVSLSSGRFFISVFIFPSQFVQECIHPIP